jgi:hypothetical protein
MSAVGSALAPGRSYGWSSNCWSPSVCVDRFQQFIESPVLSQVDCAYTNVDAVNAVALTEAAVDLGI